MNQCLDKKSYICTLKYGIFSLLINFQIGSLSAK
jgi:hypothetical protein